MMSSMNKDFVCQMQSERFKIFTSQDLDKGNFDVKFVIEEKIIYANRFILTPVSGTLDAWLSDRWSNKDEPIKIESYNYDNFYEFLCFLYIGNCKLTNENIREIVDMAEFFAVPCLKTFCDNFLSKMDYPLDTIEEWYDFAQQYSLTLFTASITRKIYVIGDRIIDANNFSSFKKSFVEVFADAVTSCGRYKEEFFEAAYKWVENQITGKSAGTNDENIDLQEVIKTELYTLISHSNFAEMRFDFLMKFVVEHDYYVSPSKFFFAQRYPPKETIFRSTYELAEKQALKKQMLTPVDDFNLDDSVKADFVDVLPNVKFYWMNKQFLMDFVIEKGFVLSSEDFLKCFDCSFFEEGRENAFENVYELAEKQSLKKQSIADQNGENFNLADSIKAELIEVIPHSKLCYMNKQFLIDYVFEKGFFLSAAEFSLYYNNFIYMGAQQTFQSVYELAEKQAIQKQKMSSDPENFNVADSIKTDLAEVIPQIKFYCFDKQFLHDFVVANGFISVDDANRVYDTLVRIRSGDQVLTGTFTDDYGIRRKYDKGADAYRRSKAPKLRFCKIKIPIPDEPSTVLKMKGVDWYLCLEKDGVFSIKHHNYMEISDYLIAPMDNNYKFQLDGHIYLTFSDNV